MLIAFTAVFIVPFAMGLYLSLCKFTTVDNAVFTGFENFKAAFTDQNFLNALWFTVKFTVVSVVTVNVIAFFLALLLTRGMRGSNLFRTVFFMPNLIGGIVLGYIWNLILNGVLGTMGVDITYSASYGFWGLVILMNWQMIGYMMVIYIAGHTEHSRLPHRGGAYRRRLGISDAEKHHNADDNALCHHLHIFNAVKLIQAV